MPVAQEQTAPAQQVWWCEADRADPVRVRRPRQRRLSVRFVWTKIVRHQMFRGTSSPNDPALAQYWTHGRERPPADPGQVHRDPAQNPKPGRIRRFPSTSTGSSTSIASASAATRAATRTNSPLAD